MQRWKRCKIFPRRYDYALRATIERLTCVIRIFLLRVNIVCTYLRTNDDDDDLQRKVDRVKTDEKLD